MSCSDQCKGHAINKVLPHHVSADVFGLLDVGGILLESNWTFLACKFRLDELTMGRERFLSLPIASIETARAPKYINNIVVILKTIMGTIIVCIGGCLNKASSMFPL